MQITIVAVGRIKEKFLQDGIAEYIKRLRPYVKLKVIELTEEKRPASATASVEMAAMEKEGDRLLASVPAGSYVIVLDLRGCAWSSEELAESFQRWSLSGKNHIVFLIGGDLGVPPSVMARGDLRLSLSPMTFTHPIARFLLMEQIYRAQRIRSGEPYHK